MECAYSTHDLILPFSSFWRRRGRGMRRLEHGCRQRFPCRQRLGLEGPKRLNIGRTAHAIKLRVASCEKKNGEYPQKHLAILSPLASRLSPLAT